MRLFAVSTIAAVLLAATSAQAKILHFHVNLNGSGAASPTDSKARATRS
jgi:hypothetical protein